MRVPPAITAPGQSFTWSLSDGLFPLLTLVFVVATAIGISPAAPVILALLVAGVVILGLPHGALDPFVATQLWGERQSFTMIRFLLLYTALAAVCAAVWMIIPNVALAVFLGISAYHFGSDWEGRCTTWGQNAFGISVVSVSTLCQAEKVEEIYRQLGASVAHQIVAVSQVLAVVAVVAALLAASSRSKFQLTNRVELATVVVGGLVLPPLLFFTCYFCLLHSPRHLRETARKLNLIELKDIARHAAPVVLATLVLGVGLWVVLPGHAPSQKVIQAVFIGLAALTTPHMLLTELNQRRSLLSTQAVGCVGLHKL